MAQGQPYSLHPRGLHCHHLWENLIHSWAWWGKAFTDEETTPRQKAPCKLVVEGISSHPDNSLCGTGVKWISGFPTPCLSLLTLILPVDDTAQFMNKTNHDAWTSRVPTLGSRGFPRWVLTDNRTMHWKCGLSLSTSTAKNNDPLFPLHQCYTLPRPQNMTGHFWG